MLVRPCQEYFSRWIDFFNLKFWKICRIVGFRWYVEWYERKWWCHKTIAGEFYSYYSKSLESIMQNVNSSYVFRHFHPDRISNYYGINWLTLDSRMGRDVIPAILLSNSQSRSFSEKNIRYQFSRFNYSFFFCSSKLLILLE